MVRLLLQKALMT